MASDNEASCESDPNFAVICAFMEKFGGTCGLASVGFLELQEMLENTQEVPQELVDLHIKLLRKSRKTVSNERWEKAVIKFCHTFCVQDAWEIERFGYKKARLSSKLRVLKELLEMQFDYNARFKAEINKMSAEELRSQPLGKDKHGHAYWFQNDDNCQIRVYKEDPDEETWTLVARDRDGLAGLISELSDGDSKLSSESGINEDDSNSLAEKPIIDTGQVDSSSESAKKTTSTDSESSNESTKKDPDLVEIGAKRVHDSDEDEVDAKKPKLEIGDAVEGPLMLVKGEGSGEDNQENNNPIVGDEIEEEVMFFGGVGSGAECETGNEDRTKQQAPEGSSAGKSSDYSISDSAKSPYKLGTIIDTKTDSKSANATRSAAKKSRWDVETIVAEEPPAEDAEAPKKTAFFFGPGRLHFGPTATVGFGQKVPQEVNAKGDVGYRIGGDDGPLQTPSKETTEDEEAAKCDARSKSVPGIEEPCVKKHAYLLGGDEEKNHVENHHEPVPAATVSTRKEDVSSSTVSDNDVKNDLGSTQTTDTEEVPRNREIEIHIAPAETCKDSKCVTKDIVDDTEKSTSKRDNRSRNNDSLKVGQDADYNQVKDVDHETVDAVTVEANNASNPLKVDTESEDNTEAEKSANPELIEAKNAIEPLRVDAESEDITEAEKSANTQLIEADTVTVEANNAIDPLIVDAESEDITEAEKSANTQLIEADSVAIEVDTVMVEADKSVDTDSVEADKSEDHIEARSAETHCVNTKPNADNSRDESREVAESNSSERGPTSHSDIAEEPKRVVEGRVEEANKILPDNCGTESNIVELKAPILEAGPELVETNNQVAEEITNEVEVKNNSTEKATEVVESGACETESAIVGFEEEKDNVRNINEDETQSADVAINQETKEIDGTGSCEASIASCEEAKENIKNSESAAETLSVVVDYSKEAKGRDSCKSEETSDDSTEKMVETVAATKEVVGDLKSSEDITSAQSHKETVETGVNAMEDIAIVQESKPIDIIDISQTDDGTNEREVPKDKASVSQFEAPAILEAEDSSDSDLDNVEDAARSDFEDEANEEIEKDPNLVEVATKTSNQNELCRDVVEDASALIEDNKTVVNTDAPQLEPSSIIQGITSELEAGHKIQPSAVEAVGQENPGLCSLSNIQKITTDVVDQRKIVDVRPELDDLNNSTSKVEVVETKIEAAHVSVITGPRQQVVDELKDQTTDDGDDTKILESVTKLQQEVVGQLKDNKVCEVLKSEQTEEHQKLDLSTTQQGLVTKEAVVVLDTLKIDFKATKTNRKNEEQTPKTTSMRRTRSSKNDFEDAPPLMLQPQRRHRARKSKDEEVKKMKMSEDAAVLVESNSSSNDVVDVSAKDPLAVSEDEVVTKSEAPPAEEAKPMSLATFSLDFNESPTDSPIVRSPALRKRGRESPQNAEEPGERAGKRPKIKGKRAVDVKLRKSIEKQKKKELASSDEDTKNSERKGEEGASCDAETKKRNKNKRLLSNLGIDPDRVLIDADATIGVRQSRRIAQLKIKEEAERRKLEDELVIDTHKKKKSKKSEDKDYKVEKKRIRNDNDEEEVGEDDSRDSKKKKKRKKKHRLFDELNPWRSSSDSSTSEEEEDEEIAEESDEVLQYVSDHEFSPESDLEGDGEAQPLKRARTARKESDLEEVDDCPCQKCGKSDHPEWILLCDQCDNGWHCSCLRPPLLVIPEGDWFCPPCQHLKLLRELQEKLQEFDKKLSKKEMEDRRKQRLAYVGISLNSVLPENAKRRRMSDEEEDDDEDDVNDADVDEDVVPDENDSSSDESESGSVSEVSATPSPSASDGDDDEPIYQLRQRRQAHSYRFNDYDELINSAIQDEMEAVKGAGNQGRGKDIATIVNAEKEDDDGAGEKVEGEVEREPLPPVVPIDDRDKEAKPLYSDEEPIGVRKKKIVGKKKHRKLNSLDISSEDDDEGSDEDFKGTSSESDDEFEEDLGSDDSEVLNSGRGRRKGTDPIRRSTRARTSRYDADFIDDGDSEDEEEAPRRKKKRSIWDESESEESDRSWGRRKRKPPPSRQKKSAASNTSSSKKKKSKKKKKENDDSDAEVYKKKKPKIKFGMDGESEGPIRRTRGKKINYVDALGSDSDDDRVKRHPRRIESEEEYVGDDDATAKLPKIQSYADPQFTRLLPEGVPTPRVGAEDDESTNPIDQINRNVEMMDENEMEKMMEEEEYANKQLQLVALQLEKEKRRKEREAKKLEEEEERKKTTKEAQFQFSAPMQEPIVGNVDSLIVNSDNNDELSEPPGVSLPMFAELGTGGDGLEDLSKKRRGKNKKSLEEAVANLGTTRQPQEAFVPQAHPTDLSSQDTNIEIAAPPQPFSQSQPTPSVITRMLQNKPGQPAYPVGTIRPKQFAAMPERDEDIHHPGQYIQGLRPYRPLPPSMNHYPPRPPPPLRNPSPLMYHPHRPMDPSPSGGGTIAMAADHSPARVVSPAASSPGGKNETPPPPYARPPPPSPVGRFPLAARHMHLGPPHLRPNLSPYHPGMPPTAAAAAAAYHYGQFEDALPPTVYQNPASYGEQFAANEAPPLDNSNSKSYDEESGGEFGGLVSYFSSQREDDLES